MVAALKELVDDIEEVLSARAKGAIGGGLEECMGGLKGLDCRRRKRKVRHSRNIWVQHFKTFVTFHLFCVHAPVCMPRSAHEGQVTAFYSGSHRD